METSIDILLVEDNPADIELTMLGFKFYKPFPRIHVVRDGAEALTFLLGTDGSHPRQRDLGPKLILLDLKLPRVDGLEVLNTIKANPETRPIPVVVLTSSKEERDMLRSYEFGVNSYICKPVDFDKFKGIVKQLSIYWLSINETPS